MVIPERGRGLCSTLCNDLLLYPGEVEAHAQAALHPRGSHRMPDQNMHTSIRANDTVKHLFRIWIRIGSGFKVRMQLGLWIRIPNPDPNPSRKSDHQQP